MCRIGKTSLRTDLPREMRGVMIILEVSIARVMNCNNAVDGSDLMHYI